MSRAAELLKGLSEADDGPPAFRRMVAYFEKKGYTFRPERTMMLAKMSTDKAAPKNFVTYLRKQGFVQDDFDEPEWIHGEQGADDYLVVNDYGRFGFSIGWQP